MSNFTLATASAGATASLSPQAPLALVSEILARSGEHNAQIQMPAAWTQQQPQLQTLSPQGIPAIGTWLTPDQLRNWQPATSALPGRDPATGLSGFNGSLGLVSGLVQGLVQGRDAEDHELLESEHGHAPQHDHDFPLLSLRPDQLLRGGVQDTGLKDAKGRNIRLTPEAGAGLHKILAIARHRGIQVRVSSAYRSVEHQQELWTAALKKYGTSDKARKWVAPPGRSRHNFGQAIDMSMYRQGKKISQREFDEIIAQAGMYRPMSWEGWHIEPLVTKAQRGQK